MEEHSPLAAVFLDCIGDYAPHGEIVICGDFDRCIMPVGRH